MKAISLWQPWASLVAIGSKRFETRSWPTNYRGPVAIHAAKRWTKDQIRLVQREPFAAALAAAGLTSGSSLPRGGIVAVANLAACLEVEVDLFASGLADVEDDPRERAFGDYMPGRFAWALTNVRRVRPMVPCPGFQQFWELKSSVIAEIEEAIFQAAEARP